MLGNWMPCLPEGQELCGLLSGVLSKVLFPPSTFSGTCSGPITSLGISALNSPSLVGIMLSGERQKTHQGVPEQGDSMQEGMMKVAEQVV